MSLKENNFKENDILEYNKEIFIVKRYNNNVCNCKRCDFRNDPYCLLKKDLRIYCNEYFASNFYFKSLGKYLDIWKSNLKKESKKK